MMNQKTLTRITGIIFAVIGVLHLLRAVFGWQAVIGSVTIPMWLSWVALAVAAYLAYSAFTAK